MKRFIGLLLFISFTVAVSAQTFKGSVTDKAGNPVAHAALYLKEIKSGFTTDEYGRFQAKLSVGSYTCEVSSLGFISQQFTFQMPERDYEKNIVLDERIYALPEVAIAKKGEDPAYAVMRKAIARASYHRTQVKGFKAGAYLKGTGRGTSIPALLKLSKEVRTKSKEMLGKLFLLEEQQVITFTAPAHWDKRVLAYKNSFPEELQVEMGLTTFNFYTPQIFGKISPLNPKAFSYYRFRLDGFFEENGQMINKIRVIPRREDKRLIEGDLFIVEDLWCVSAAEVNIHGSGLKARIKVIGKEVQPAVFLPVSLHMTTTIDLMGFKAEASYLSAVHYTEVRTDRKAEEPSAPSEKTNAVVAALPKKHKYERPSVRVRSNTQIDSLAGQKDSLYWDTIRSVPLRQEELQSYLYKEEKIVRKDSVDEPSPGKPSLTGKMLNTLLFGRTFRTTDRKAWLTISGITSCLPNYNFVDGFWLGTELKMGTRLSESSALHFNPMLCYTTARKRWIGQGELALDYAPRRRGNLSLTGGRLSADYNGESGESRLVNALSSALSGHNHLKLYEKTFFTLSHAIEPLNSLLFSTSLSWQRRKMLDNHIHHSWFKREAEPNVPENADFLPMPENELLKLSLGLEYTPAHYYRLSKGKKVYEESRYPTFTLKYDRAFPMKDSRYQTSYHMMQFSARQNIEFGMFNRFNWSVNAGLFWKARNLQFPDFKHFASTDIWVTTRSFDTGFNLLGNYALSTNTRWVQGNLSWYTPYLLLKQLPFLSGTSFDEALHLRSAFISGKRSYTELGYSVGVSKVARVGVFAGFESLKFRSIGGSISFLLLQLLSK